MCGIIGYVGHRPCQELLLHGLERLEYRGYDSAGLALREDDGLDYVRAVGDLVEAVRAAYRTLEGHFAFVVIHHGHPSLLVGARRHCPLIVGVGDGETFLASMAAAFLGETRRVQLIEEDEIVAVTPEGAT